MCISVMSMSKISNSRMPTLYCTPTAELDTKYLLGRMLPLNAGVHRWARKVRYSHVSEGGGGGCSSWNFWLRACQHSFPSRRMLLFSYHRHSIQPYALIPLNVHGLSPYKANNDSRLFAASGVGIKKL